MQCDTFEKIWIEYGTESLPREARKHLESCASCRALIRETEVLANRLDSFSPTPIPNTVKSNILKKIGSPFYSPDLILNLVALLGLAIIFGFNLELILHGIITGTGYLTHFFVSTPWYVFSLGGLIFGSLIIAPVLRKIL
ncbi:hypothetical protein [Fidelibacter multiformis]|uniref:hypothetical protein n=1 Tax=Fidelibacter multiformis TaxID=3377529 RepID=UPI0037DD78C6